MLATKHEEVREGEGVKLHCTLTNLLSRFVKETLRISVEGDLDKGIAFCHGGRHESILVTLSRV